MARQIDNQEALKLIRAAGARLINCTEPKTVAEAKIEVFEFIEIWRPPLRYNRKRIYASLRYLTPVEYESGADAQKLKYYRYAA